MSLFTDVKYLNQIGNRLTLFKRKGDYLYNCRCPICGDSQTKKNKARGYFYRANNDLFFKCHNCDASQHFGTFLKNFDAQLYRQYAMERYSDGENRRPHANPEFKFEQPAFEVKPEKTILDELLTRVDTLPDNHEVRQFCSQRQIPADQLHRLYYIDDVKNIEQLSSKYANTIQGHEPRLVMPFRDATGRLVGVTCRALRGESLRYITIRINETAPLIFGIENVDQSKPFYAVEGPIDSLFVPNSIAVGGTGFTKLDALNLNKKNLTLVLDNQPRNSEVCKIYQKMITAGYKIFIWPDYTSAKDINDLVTLGIVTPELIQNLIDSNSYEGLTAQMKFNTWKRS